MFEFFRFELRQQLRSPLLWLMGGLFALMGFLGLTTDAVQIGGGIGNVHRNAPVVIVQYLSIFSLFGMLFVAMAVNGALLRDHEQGMADLIFASIPYKIMAPMQVPVYDEMKKRDADLYARLEKAGFMLDFGVDDDEAGV